MINIIMNMDSILILTFGNKTSNASIRDLTITIRLWRVTLISG
jgi:hypothetical protein